MTAFVKNQFDFHSAGGECWVYYGAERKFVARFKYGSPKACANQFVKHLIAHVTVEEFEAFQAMSHGTAVKRAEEKRLFEDRGYLNYNVLKMMKQYGFTKYSELRAFNRACSEVNQKAYKEGRTAQRYEYPSPSQFIGA